ncbi:DUF484 family protein [Marinicella sp. W31]|uniref:DUF484 family protein n=1 Tax=Marinicella sp. W31 TaxID=3023713 RepID=UPI0037576F5A
MSENNIKGSDVINYLNNHPDFFLRYPDLLEGLKVSNERGELTSLVQHQVQILQKKHNETNQKLHALISNARANEQLMDKLFLLLCELAVLPNDAFIGRYLSFIKSHFPTDFFVLCLNQQVFPENAPRQIIPYDDIQSHFSDFQQDEAPIAGRLRAEKLEAVFPDDHRAVKSAVVLPLGQGAAFGVMVFGSLDEEKFHPDTSTDILQKLVSILSNYLTSQHTQNEHQAVG